MSYHTDPPALATLPLGHTPDTAPHTYREHTTVVAVALFAVVIGHTVPRRAVHLPTVTASWWGSCVSDQVRRWLCVTFSAPLGGLIIPLGGLIIQGDSVSRHNDLALISEDD